MSATGLDYSALHAALKETKRREDELRGAVNALMREQLDVRESDSVIEKLKQRVTELHVSVTEAGIQRDEAISRALTAEQSLAALRAENQGLREARRELRLQLDQHQSQSPRHEHTIAGLELQVKQQLVKIEALQANALVLTGQRDNANKRASQSEADRLRMSTECERLREEVQGLHTQVSWRDQQQQDLTKQLAESQQLLQIQRQECSELQASLAQLTEQERALRRELTDVRDTLQSVEAETSRVRMEELQSQRARAQLLEQQLVDTARERGQREAEIAELRIELETLRTAAADREGELVLALEQVRAEAEASEAQNRRESQRQSRAAAQELQELRSRAAGLEKELESEREQRRRAEETVGTLRAAVKRAGASAKSRQSRFEADAAELRAELDTRAKSQQQLQDRLRASALRVEQLTADLEAAQERAVVAEARANEAQSRLSEQLQKSEALQRDLEAANTRVKEAQNHIEELHEALLEHKSGRRQALASLRDQCEVGVMLTERSGQALRDAQSTDISHREELSVMQASLEAKREECVALQEELATLRAQLDEETRRRQQSEFSAAELTAERDRIETELTSALKRCAELESRLIVGTPPDSAPPVPLARCKEILRSSSLI